MDFDTFISFIDKVKEEETIRVGDYTIRYFEKPSIRVTSSYKSIQYFREGYMIGRDYINERYKIGDIMPTLTTSFDDDKGIKSFNKLIDYLDYLYGTNIERLKREKLEREQELLEKKREEELRERKLNDFLGI